MTFHIVLNHELVSHMEAGPRSAVIIPFTGTVESPLFTGRVLPGAADVQQVNAAGVRHMCARYMFEGTDSSGSPCKLFVENNGYFQRDGAPKPYFDATPTFLTDSPLLAPYLHTARFRAEGHGTDVGVDILIFDIEKDAPAAPEEEKASEPAAPSAAPAADISTAEKRLLLAASALGSRYEPLDADLLSRELGIPRSEAKQLLTTLWEQGFITSSGDVIPT